MARREERPHPPRISSPDLPSTLTPARGLRRGEDHFQLEIRDLDERTDAAHAEISESRLVGASAESLALAGVALVDVEVEDLRATTVSARGSRLRRVRMTGGRIGTLDLADADVDEVELRGIRIDYLSLAGARVTDLLIADCTIGSLDLPQAVLARVAFSATRCDELDTRGMRAAHVDLRGLEMLSLTDAASMSGTTLSPAQVAALAPVFAASLGVDVQA